MSFAIIVLVFSAAAFSDGFPLPTIGLEPLFGNKVLIFPA
jgi:hypothetical protein